MDYIVSLTEDQLNNLIESTSKNKKETYISIYKVIYCRNVMKSICEKWYVILLQNLCSHGFKTYHINSIEKLIIYLKNQNFTDSYNVTLLIHVREINYKNICAFSKKTYKLNRIFISKTTCADKISKIIKLSKHSKKIIKSFKNIDYRTNFSKVEGFNACSAQNNHLKLLDLSDTEGFKGCSTKNNPNFDDTWKINTRAEIISRLHLLVFKYYSLDQLRNIGIQLKYYSELQEIDYKELENYFLNCLKIIEKYYEDIIAFCKIYIDCEICYQQCCNFINSGQITFLSLKNFDIEIASKKS